MINDEASKQGAHGMGRMAAKSEGLISGYVGWDFGGEGYDWLIPSNKFFS